VSDDDVGCRRCFNRIDLPLYETAADLRAGLDFVLTAGIAEAFSMD